MAASVSGSQTGDCEDIESAGSYLLQVSHRLNISSRLDENVHQRNYIYSVGSHACSWESFYFMLAGMLISTMLFLLLGWCARTGPPQMLVGEAHLSGVEQPAKKDSTKPPHIGALDGLRGIFIVWIVFWHQMMHDTVFDAPATMQFFFVVSGFVAVKATEAQGDRMTFTSGLLFIQRRMARLFPMLWFSMLAFGITYAVGGRCQLCNLCQSGHCPTFLTVCTPGNWLVSAIGMSEAVAVNRAIVPTAWFVGVLFILNLCFPMLYNMTPSRPAAIVCFILVLIVARSSFLFFPSLEHRGYLTADDVAPRLPEFFAGMLSAAWCRQMKSLGSWPGWGYAFDASIMLALLVVPIIHFIKVSGDFGLTGVWCMICISASSAVEAPSHGSPDSGGWPRIGLLGIILNCGPIQLLGRSAWTVYMMQCPVALIVKLFLPGWFKGFMSSITSVLIGILTDVVIEQPVQRVLGRYMRDSSK